MSFAARAPRLGVRLLAAVPVALGALCLGAPAYADSVGIDHVQSDDGTLQVVLTVDGLAPGAQADLDSTTVTFDGDPVEATAQPMSEAGDAVKRTAVLAMDVSLSMRGEKFAEAKAAAGAFLDTVPDDVRVGLVTFADRVAVAQQPTLDRDGIRAALSSLELSRATRLYDGLIQAVEAGGSEGSRSVLVLSDGRNTTGADLAAATKAVDGGGAKVDVVALGQTARDLGPLEQLAKAGNGTVLNADDPAALRGLFTDEAQALAQQVLVTVSPSEEMTSREGTLSVTLDVNGSPVTDEAFVGMPAAGKDPAPQAEASTEAPPAAHGLLVPRPLMLGGLAAAAVAVAVMIVMAVGTGSSQKQDDIDRSIEAYTRKGAKRLAESHRQGQSQSVTQQAVAVAESVLEGQKGLEAALGSRLDAAGMAFKPAEWLLVHFGVAVGLGLAGLLLGGGSVLFMLLGLLLGLAAPWFFLTFKRKKRLSAFKAQLADTLQLMAGSLSAGLSLAQSVDTVVREGTDPMAGEFRRALVETRLGVEIEDALTGVAERMQSVDFEWVVMAIRIQREVGGNLAELLNKVADTIREREYLERQVKTLSAEGRLSVWILGGLPPGFMAYLLMVNPSYINPMFGNPLGVAMLIVMGVLLTGGILWMKKVVKVEV